MSEQSQPESHQNVDVNDSSISKSNVGQVIGGNLTQIQGEVVNVTVYDSVDVPGLGGRQASGSVKPLTQQDYRNRKVLLNKVKKFWIEGVLEKSLHIKALIELGLEERLDAVERPFRDVQESPDESRQTLPSGTDATQVFHQMGEGRTLLILGEPGAGKTTILLKLAQNLIARTEEDLSQLIPVVFNLSSWASERQTIADWLVGELNNKYQVSKALGKAWIEEQQLLLLLDGLDEVKAECREVCVQALNKFIQEYGQTEMAVCSRIRDYEALSARLKCQVAICVQPLTLEQINQYLERAGEQLEAMKTLLQKDTVLQELAKSPLTLSVMTLAYQGVSVEEMSKTVSVEECRKHLFNAYIERMFQRKGAKQKYLKTQTKQWLYWLAQYMFQESQSIFLIERMQPTTYLRSRFEYRVYYIGIDLLTSVLSLCIGSFFGWLIFGLFGSVLFSLLFFGMTNNFFNILSLFQLGSNKINIFLNISKLKIRTFELITFSWMKVHKTLHESFKLAVITGTLFVIIGSLFETLLDPNLLTSATYDIFSSLRVLALRLFVVLLVDLVLAIPYIVILWIVYMAPFMIIAEVGDIIEKTTFPNQGIWKSLVNSGIVFSSVLLVFSLVGALLGWLFGGLLGGIKLGLLAGALYGLFLALVPGLACIQHFILRLILSLRGNIPWNYARFLDYATDRIFLQKVGGGYIFIHRLLLEHFAQMEPEQVRR